MVHFSPLLHAASLHPGYTQTRTVYVMKHLVKKLLLQHYLLTYGYTGCIKILYFRTDVISTFKESLRGVNPRCKGIARTIGGGWLFDEYSCLPDYLDILSGSKACMCLDSLSGGPDSFSSHLDCCLNDHIFLSRYVYFLFKCSDIVWKRVDSLSSAYLCRDVDCLSHSGCREIASSCL